jgi:hypothetical protein
LVSLAISRGPAERVGDVHATASRDHRLPDAFRTGDKLPNTGYTRVAVSPSGVDVAYVRTYLPADEGPGKTSGAVAFSYSLR